MALGQYAPEYSAENIGALVNQYQKTIQPEYEKALRGVKASSFGQGLGYGSPYQAGVGEVSAGRLADIAKYNLGINQQGLQAETQGRESALQRAYGTSERLGSQAYQTGERLGSQGWQSGENVLGRQFQTSERLGGQAYGTSERLGGQDFTAGQNALGRAFQTSERLGSQAYGTSEREAGQTFTSGENTLNRALQEAGLTGIYGGNETVQAREARINQIADSIRIKKEQGLDVTADINNLMGLINNNPTGGASTTSGAIAPSVSSPEFSHMKMLTDYYLGKNWAGKSLAEIKADPNYLDLISKGPSQMPYIDNYLKSKGAL